MGWIKLWLMPWLGYHFWMSTFTTIHHMAPHIPFKHSDDWNAAQAQLNGTVKVHCDYSSGIEIHSHDIIVHVHIPHHISPRMPSYNLRAAHRSLRENWGKYLNEANSNKVGI
ncbi:omega-6 fatty acid desaturase, chloroplastic-like [Actinidia eriantha]|uniref:omega-6 fatty acid desaturase, chloroplastic-like n=1 Tax=Actinidia eriantha TaxID=165200 RepID=UPI00258675C4|nr:omega-6 fatty acid desaturase, chloroplastic-like [Actinidia eriantha]XP_057514944.1 omega-6 fatty acid desaturase, chloroplastic-like [Actinidia eriantha]XP_057514945.1 omega-6 fatty acid desaturase, chloroplastic-like [Actinidia eriantha]